MKKQFYILPLAFAAISALQSCSVALPSQGVARPVDRVATAWTAVGSVRHEYYSKFPTGVIPYDALLAEAHKQYGADVDIIEIKEDKIKLDAKTRAELIKEKKGVFNYKFVYNALVIKYK
ncbi:MAG: hypothetical protein ACK478_01400 [Flavobacteriales bacterium]|jgi:hypothetical protein